MLSTRGGKGGGDSLAAATGAGAMAAIGLRANRVRDAGLRLRCCEMRAGRRRAALPIHLQQRRRALMQAARRAALERPGVNVAVPMCWPVAAVRNAVARHLAATTASVTPMPWFVPLPCHYPCLCVRYFQRK